MQIGIIEMKYQITKKIKNYVDNKKITKMDNLHECNGSTPRT